MKKGGVYILILVLLSGCDLMRSVTKERETKTTETTLVVPRDTVVRVDGSSSKIEAMLEELLKGQEMKQTAGNSTVSLRYIPETNIVEAGCQCDTMEIMMTLLDRYFERNTETQEVVVKEPSNWGKFKYALQGGVVIMILILIIILIRKYLL